MGKLCPKGKAAAKRKFDVYPSAYANMYASAVCSGKVKPGGKKKTKKKTKKKKLKIKTAAKGGGLRKWVDEKWVDIGAPKKDGKYQPCGRKNAKKSKRKYPKCVPLAKAQRMSKSQKTSAVKRKRARPQGVGGKPTFVKTFKKKRA
tara:strand:+ start:135 stop:572 length:438 start_codon:yes stop_codon:yes gene_type:complete